MAPAGWDFDAVLDTPLSSQTSRPGDRIRAHTVEPLVASDGSVLAPTGTPLVGTVVAVGDSTPGRIAVRIDGLVLAGRVYPMASRVRSIASTKVGTPQSREGGPLVVELSPNAPAEEAAPTARSTPKTVPSEGAIGGGPPAEAQPFELSAGTPFELELVGPFELDAEASVEAAPTPR
jgi:hypothetical protein